MDFAPQRILKILEILLWPLLGLLLVASRLAIANPVENRRLSQSTLPLNEPRPHFAGKIENVTVNVGREATLECPVNHLGRYKVGWLKAKDQTILALHTRVITHNNRFIVDHEDNRIWKLKIRSVQKSDAGCYMCQINTEKMAKQEGCIDVLIPPEIDDLKTSSDVHVNEGDEANLECRANGHPKPEVRWLREDRSNFTIYDKNNKRMIVSQFRGEVLKLKRVQRHQMGAYLCIASNSVPPSVSKRIRLNVNFSPEITVSQQLHGVGPGANITIQCKVEAHPTAINYWMKDTAEMLLDGPKYHIKEEVINDYESIMTLTIKNWQKTDESHFTCISTNSLGKADGKIQAYTFERTELDTGNDETFTEYSGKGYGNIKERTEYTSVDEITYQSPEKDANNKNKNRNNRFHENYQSDKDKDRRRQNSNNNNGTPKKSSFGSSLFSNSSKQITQNHLFVFILLLLTTLIKSSSLLILY